MEAAMLRIVCAALIGVAAGCATSGSSSSPPGDSGRDELISGELGTVRLNHDDASTTTEFAEPRDKVWEALLRVNEELALPMLSADPKAGVLTYFLQTHSHRIAGKPASSYLDCGGGATGNNADSHSIKLKVSESVTSNVQGRSVVRIALLASSKDMEVSAYEGACSSRGSLEKRIVDLVRTRLQQ
jgi:hypothetical protein